MRRNHSSPLLQVRPITPPPESPPPNRNMNRSRGSRQGSRVDTDTAALTSISRIENTVAQVAEEAAEYARRHEEVLLSIVF